MRVRHPVLMVAPIAAACVVNPYTAPPASTAADLPRLDGLGFKAPGRRLSYSPARATKKYSHTTKAKRKAAKLARRRNRRR